MRDVSRLTFNELAEEGELLVIGHDVRRATNLSLCDEHFQMGHDLVFELLMWPDVSEIKREMRMKEGKGGRGGGF